MIAFLSGLQRFAKEVTHDHTEDKMVRRNGADDCRNNTAVCVQKIFYDLKTKANDSATNHSVQAVCQGSRLFKAEPHNNIFRNFFKQRRKNKRLNKRPKEALPKTSLRLCVLLNWRKISKQRVFYHIEKVLKALHGP